MKQSARAKYAVLLLLGSGLCLMGQTSTTDDGPVFSPKVSRLLGIYEAVPAAGKPDQSDVLPITPAAAKAQANAKPGPDPKDVCQVLGPFRMMARVDVKFEILRDAPNKLVVLFENEAWGHLRTIAVDADHDDNLVKARPLWNGDSVAKWEGDTLVIDSTHFTNKTWLDEAGVANSKQLHLTERLRLVDGGRYLEYQATATDPEVLMEPVAYTRRFKRTTDEIREYDCFAHKPTKTGEKQ